MSTSLKLYQVDAFTDKVFSGNPAAVCPLVEWLEDDVLQRIAMENNLAETAFYLKQKEHYEIRWFTPTVEVDLCGHATLAAAYVLFHHEGHTMENIRFESRKSGTLTVRRDGDWLTLDFPQDSVQEIEISPTLKRAFDKVPVRALQGKTDVMLCYRSEAEIKELRPNLQVIHAIGGRGVIVTAEGDDVDFVSRFFAPQSGIDEDPVTGSAHTTLTPYWASQLGKEKMTARQLSRRGGALICSTEKDRVLISGQAQLYLQGRIQF